MARRDRVAYLHRMVPRQPPRKAVALSQRLDRLDWSGIERELAERGHARTFAVLSAGECAGLVRLYEDDARFRSRVVMERHRFGVGEYKYFAAPLPPLVAELRERLYPPLATVANHWMEALRLPERFPSRLPAFLERCARAGQAKPTPLLLRYTAGGYNCLHQDVYGDVGFPLQAAVFLSRPGRDYTGGTFLLVEQRPRAQSVGEALLPEQGEMVIFTNRFRPVAGTRGFYRANVRHGVSRIEAGQRMTLGIIFHNAR